MLRAANLRQRLLLRPSRPSGGFGRNTVKRHHGEGQLRLLVPTGPTHPHGRHRPHRHANPLPALQRRRGQGVCQAEIRDTIGRGGQMRRAGGRREKDRKDRTLLRISHKAGNYLPYTDLRCVLAAVDCLVAPCQSHRHTVTLTLWVFRLIFRVPQTLPLFTELLYSTQAHRHRLTQPFTHQLFHQAVNTYSLI